METTKDFFDKVKTAGEKKYHYQDSINKNMEKWRNAYNKANNLEINNDKNTFLFSAQHKDCIILSTILTALNNSNTIIWRTNDVKTLEIGDNTTEKERSDYAENMSASLSLIDWEINESANCFLIQETSISNTNMSSCKRLLDKLNYSHAPVLKNTITGKIKESINQIKNTIKKSFLFNSKESILKKSILNIIKKYYNDLENRYLCVFEFNDEQLNRYVRLSKSFGETVNVIDNMKSMIKNVKKKYLGSVNNNAEYENELQSRILVTHPSSIDPYKTYILDSEKAMYSRMKEEIIQAITQQNVNIISSSIDATANGGRNQTKRKKTNRKKSKRRRC